MIKLHTSLPDALKYGKTWMGIAGALATLAQNMTGHRQELLFTASTICMIAGFIISSPNAKPKDQQEGGSDAQ